MTNKTAAELVVARADANKLHMSLKSFSGSRVRKTDVIMARNYLNAKEVDTLNGLVVIFLGQTELRAKNHQQLVQNYWRNNVDKLLAFNVRSIPKGAGIMAHASMKSVAKVQRSAELMKWNELINKICRSWKPWKNT